MLSYQKQRHNFHLELFEQASMKYQQEKMDLANTNRYEQDQQI